MTPVSSVKLLLPIEARLGQIPSGSRAHVIGAALESFASRDLAPVPVRILGEQLKTKVSEQPMALRLPTHWSALARSYGVSASSLINSALFHVLGL